jgi:hypothetical protein
MDKLISAGLIVVAACAHSTTRPEAPPEGLVKWANSFPLAAQELCGWERDHPQDAMKLYDLSRDRPTQVANALQFAAMNPTPNPAGAVRAPGEPDPWRGDVTLAGDPVMSTLIDWAKRHPDAAQQLDPKALEWTAAHRGC